MSKLILRDGILERHIDIDAGHQATAVTTQPSRDIILERNKELRKNPGAINHLGHMGLEYTMPLVDYNLLMKRIETASPGIKHSEKMEQLTKYLQRHGHIYKVRESNGPRH